MHGKVEWKNVLQAISVIFIATPLAVLLHELAHVLAFTLGGMPSRLVALGSMTPIGFDYTFDGLRQAQNHYGTGDATVVIGALAGPLFTLLLGFAGLWAFRRWSHIALWAVAYSAVAVRSVSNLVGLTSKVIDGTINSSDEAIGAFFLGWPLWGLWWLLVVGVICMVLLIAALPRHRWPLAVLGFVSSILGFFTVEYLVNTFVFQLTSWDR